MKILVNNVSAGGQNGAWGLVVLRFCALLVSKVVPVAGIVWDRSVGASQLCSDCITRFPQSWHVVTAPLGRRGRNVPDFVLRSFVSMGLAQDVGPLQYVDDNALWFGIQTCCTESLSAFGLCSCGFVL